MKCLIDADILLYSCGFSAEKPIWKAMVGDKTLATFRYKKELDEWAGSGEEIKDLKLIKDKEVQPVANALSNAKKLIQKILLRADADSYQLYLTGKDNFREEIATIAPYKGNRDSTHKPYHYDSLKRYLIENWGAIVIDGMEADDAMSIEQINTFRGQGTNKILDPEIFKDLVGGSIIATIDKDLDGVPGWHYNWNKDKLYWVTDREATYWFYTQLLTGDTVDNIKGVPRVGEKGAEKAYKGCETEEDLYWEALCLYGTKYDKPLEALVENARLLYMLREEGLMWLPPA